DRALQGAPQRHPEALAVGEVGLGQGRAEHVRRQVHGSGGGEDGGASLPAQADDPDTSRPHLDRHLWPLRLPERPPGARGGGGRAHPTSTNVTLLISCRVVWPARALFTADSRRKTIPSSRAARLISALERRARISSR